MDRVCIDIEQGQHPVIAQLVGQQEQYVPNDTHMGVSVLNGCTLYGNHSDLKFVSV